MNAKSPPPLRLCSARRELKLLCLVEQAPEGGIRCLPIHTCFLPDIPWAAVPRKWSRTLPAGFILRDARATAPSPAALARCRRQHLVEMRGRQGRNFQWKPLLVAARWGFLGRTASVCAGEELSDG